MYTAEQISELIQALLDAENNSELDCEIHELRPVLRQAADALTTIAADNEALRADKITIKLRTNEDLLTPDEAIETINRLRKAYRKQKEELAALREAIARYCRNDCYRDACTGNENVGIPDCTMAKYAPLPAAPEV
jgi:CRISPR/Cas system CMR subunit Cmr4 (Cas7 group RAMP superfamily)